MRKIWQIRESRPDIQDSLSSALKISKVTAQLLANRGIDDPDRAKEFLGSSLSACPDPFLLKDMEKAVDRVKRAIAGGEKIIVYGDYDVDGITGVTLLRQALKSLKADVESYIPNRIEEGYGLNLTAIKKVHRLGATLIVTVDCGITSFKEIEYAKSLNIDVIVTDHHEILESQTPKAYAVINPLQGTCGYPFKHLAGVGLAYKLAKALYEDTPYFAEDFLDLVSLGTVADLVPLVGENRVLTKYGLEELNSRARVGLKALMEVSGLKHKDISAGHIGFILGPRINAMGRIGSPEKALELLLSDNPSEAARLAKVLDSENRNRQKIEARILEEAISKAEREINFKYHKIIVLASEGWHPGVIGIVASRLVERYYRPAILISLDGKFGKGSGRSIERVHLFNYLFRCRELLIGFGGHESACGITIEKDKIEELKERLNLEMAKDASAEAFDQTLEIDMDIPLNALTEDVINEIEELSPFGIENPRPVLVSRNLIVKDGPRQIGRNGFKMCVTDNNITCEAVSFRRDSLEIPEPGSAIDLAYVPSINSWQGLKSIQLELRDIQSSG